MLKGINERRSNMDSIIVEYKDLLTTLISNPKLSFEKGGEKCTDISANIVMGSLFSRL